MKRETDSGCWHIKETYCDGQWVIVATIRATDRTILDGVAGACRKASGSNRQAVYEYLNLLPPKF